MQHENFWNLNRMIFTQRKHLKSRAHGFSYCFPVINRHAFYYLIKSAPIPENQSSFEILQLFIDIIF